MADRMEVQKQLKRKLESVDDVDKAPGAKKEKLAPPADTLGRVFVWGRNDCGQLGLGEDVEEALRPKPLAFDEEVVDIACGGLHAAVVTAAGEVFTWGVNDEGALGRQTDGEHWEKADEELKKISPVARDSYVPGKVYFPEDGVKIVQVVAGDSSCFALDAKGVIWGWGTFRNTNGVLGFDPSARLQLVPRKVVVVPGDSDRVVKIACGANHVVCMTMKNIVYTWGTSEQGALGRFKNGEISDEVECKGKILLSAPVKLDEKVVDVFAGQYGTFFVLENGDVWGCGLNNTSQMGLGKNDTRNILFTPEKLANLGAVKEVTGGSFHTIALSGKGGALSCGRTTYGCLGLSEVEDISKNESKEVPQSVSGLDDVQVKGVAAYDAVSGCFDANGDVYMWGLGSSGHLATGADEEDQKTPCKVRRPRPFSGFHVKKMSIGGMHVAVLADKSG